MLVWVGTVAAACVGRAGGVAAGDGIGANVTVGIVVGSVEGDSKMLTSYSFSDVCVGGNVVCVTGCGASDGMFTDRGS